MPFTIPEFNIECNVFTNADSTQLRIANLECNLAFGRRSALATVGSDPVGEVFTNPGSMHLLLPARSDVRDFYSDTGADLVEVPADTGRFYLVLMVDDIGRGFDNEHRIAVLVKRGGPNQFWPTPIP